MAKFRVRYFECYEDYYEVEANSKEEAEEILKEDIYEGKENSPESCYDSGAEAEEMGDSYE